MTAENISNTHARTHTFGTSVAVANIGRAGTKFCLLWNFISLCDSASGSVLPAVHLYGFVYVAAVEDVTRNRNHELSSLRCLLTQPYAVVHPPTSAGI